MVRYSELSKAVRLLVQEWRAVGASDEAMLELIRVGGFPTDADRKTVERTIDRVPADREMKQVETLLYTVVMSRGFES